MNCKNDGRRKSLWQSPWPQRAFTSGVASGESMISEPVWPLDQVTIPSQPLALTLTSSPAQTTVRDAAMDGTGAGPTRTLTKLVLNSQSPA